MLSTTFQVGRSRMTLHATNNGTEPVTIGEFTTAGIRFTNKMGATKLDPNYPAELVASAGLTMDSEAAIQPGQTVDVKIESKDVPVGSAAVGGYSPRSGSALRRIVDVLDREG